MKEFLEELKGLEVVDVHSNRDGSFAILFDDGFIIHAPVDHEVVFMAGGGWESIWETLKSDVD